MEKVVYENLGELDRIIYDHLLAAFNANEYKLEMVGSVFDGRGYLNARLIICGTTLECSLNEKNYVCWFCGEPFKYLLAQVPHLERKLVAQAKRFVRQKTEEWRNMRIKELEDELTKLKEQ